MASVGTLAIPILALAIASIPLFVDLRSQRHRGALIAVVVLLIAACVFQITSGISDRERIRWGKDRITDLTSTLAAFRGEAMTSLLTIEGALRGFGWSGEQAVIADLVEQSFAADVERTQLAAQKPPADRRRITVQYFPKQVDRTIVEGALRSLGFNLVTGTAALPHLATNAIWFGDSVPLDDVKLVAYTLIRAGVRITSIRPFRQPTKRRSRLIQVGSDAVTIEDRAVSVGEIAAATGFER